MVCSFSYGVTEEGNTKKQGKRLHFPRGECRTVLACMIFGKSTFPLAFTAWERIPTDKQAFALERIGIEIITQMRNQGFHSICVCGTAGTVVSRE